MTLPFRSLFHVSALGEVREYLLEQDEILIGRGSGCDVVVNEDGVGERHARLTFGEGCRVTDLGSGGGTLVDGLPVGGEGVLLVDGAVIRIGGSSLRFIGAVSEPELPLPGAPFVKPVARVPPDAEAVVRLESALVAGSLGESILTETPAILAAGAAEPVVLPILLSRAAGARLIVTENGRTRSIPLAGKPFWQIGRASECDARLATSRATRLHARISCLDERFALQDLDTRDGTLVNGAPTRECVLAEGDTIRIGEATLVFRDNPGRAAPESAAATENAAAQDTTGQELDRRPVVVVPGFGGTELFSGDDRVWPGLRRLADCPIDRLPEYWGDLRPGRATREAIVVPGQMRNENYGRLLDFLGEDLGYVEGHDLLEFGYDWRQDNRANARLLAERVGAWRSTLADPKARLTLVAHGMGGLLCRYYLEHLGGSDVCDRLVMMGTPHRGSTRVFQMLIAGADATPPSAAAGKLCSVARHFPSVYQMLPDSACVRQAGGRPFDPLAEDGWLPKPLRKSLVAARELRIALAATERKMAPSTCIFGYGLPTLREMRVERAPDGSLAVTGETYDQAGDDAVLEESAVLPGVDVHPVRQRHGALFADKDVQRRLRFELTGRRLR